jgi:hypothetical protein
MSTAAIGSTDGGDRIKGEARRSTPAARSSTPIGEFAHTGTGWLAPAGHRALNHQVSAVDMIVDIR